LSAIICWNEGKTVAYENLTGTLLVGPPTLYCD
jgi:hypothetical protein